MIIAAVKLSDIELDVDAERAKPSGNEAGQVVSFGVYITAILLAPRFISENNRKEISTRRIEGSRNNKR